MKYIVTWTEEHSLEVEADSARDAAELVKTGEVDLNGMETVGDGNLDVRETNGDFVDSFPSK